MLHVKSIAPPSTVATSLLSRSAAPTCYRSPYPRFPRWLYRHREADSAVIVADDDVGCAVLLLVHGEVERIIQHLPHLAVGHPVAREFLDVVGVDQELVYLHHVGCRPLASLSRKQSIGDGSF